MIRAMWMHSLSIKYVYDLKKKCRQYIYNELL